ncbi:glycosyltransferase family 9 protein [Mucilaginibacter terrae]|uniref:Lipopolysaccharide heptosyltransferase II n=1 Tax=Mucilaginibacter terrae TaxID=1955052 RepID=A0ABU3H092_9SPHI|nr:glycosyltransferase family 9 protein [Mucilaginibacter terrae]MDT3405296.1 lipopolysaccharide heptosyltransferase II [Mucilaginibacter terrae]
MGDLIMSAPAIRALKETFGAKITVLTSSMAKGIIKHMPEIDDAIIYDLPWVKTAEAPDPSKFNEIIGQLREQNFDAAVVFTVFSQNPLPTAMLAYLSGIPRILAYCRENPYHLITDWVPDKEPYELIKHQVRRDLDLVASVGAYTDHEDLLLSVDHELQPVIAQKLTDKGFDINYPWLILHAGVSEEKRQYPADRWVALGQELVKKGYQVLLTGSASEKPLTDELQNKIGTGSLSAGGMFSLSEFITLISIAPMLVSVNTGTIHIAAAVKTPTVILYAQTNPQHTPWNSPNQILEFSVPENLRSKNEIIRHLGSSIYKDFKAIPSVTEILKAIDTLKVKAYSL